MPAGPWLGAKRVLFLFATFCVFGGKLRADKPIRAGANLDIPAIRQQTEPVHQRLSGTIWSRWRNQTWRDRRQVALSSISPGAAEHSTSAEVKSR